MYISITYVYIYIYKYIYTYIYIYIYICKRAPDGLAPEARQEGAPAAGGLASFLLYIL